jgi:hypothetical protein
MIKARRRRAFSLIAVLVIALAGMALVGGILYAFNSFSGASRLVVSDSWEYNLLQEAAERGKAYVREKILAIDPDQTGINGHDMTWEEKVGGATKISKHSDLLIHEEALPTPAGARGVRGAMRLYIFDVDYDAEEDLAALFPEDEKALLPPALPSGIGIKDRGFGTYLIRAVFVDDTGVEKSIETAIVQSKKCGCGCKGLCGCGGGKACGCGGGGSYPGSCGGKCGVGGGGGEDYNAEQKVLN